MAVTEQPLSLLFGFSYFVLYFLLTIFSVLVTYYFWFESLRSTKLGNKLPGPKPLPIIGNAHFIMSMTPTEIMNTALQLVSENGKTIRFWFGSKLGVCLLDPRDVELILGSNDHLEKSSEYRFFEPWLGDGLLISKGEKWRSHRKMIAPTFHQSILKTFIPTFNKNAQELVDFLRKEAVGKVCDIHDYMSGTTVDVLLETVMGIKKQKQSESSFKYAKAVMEMCNILHIRHIRIWLRLDFLFKLTKLSKMHDYLLKIIHGLTDKVIVNKKKEYFQRVYQGETTLYQAAVKETEKEDHQNSFQEMNFGSGLRDDLDDVDEKSVCQKKRLAFLDFMIEAGETQSTKLRDKEIRDEVNTIMFEGHDTTASASSFFICILGVHQDIQEKVYQEMKDIFQDSDRPVTFQDICQMKYLERVLLETLRLYPPVPIITRIIHKDVKLASNNLILPKGTTVGIGQYMIHRDPTYYPNPEIFDPDNFLPERCQERHHYSFIPFSAGPRSCVGRKYAMLKLKILLSTIVRNFKIKSTVDEKDFQLQADIILKRADGFNVVLEERK